MGGNEEAKYDTHTNKDITDFMDEDDDDCKEDLIQHMPLPKRDPKSTTLSPPKVGVMSSFSQEVKASPRLPLSSKHLNIDDIPMSDDEESGTEYESGLDV